MNENNKLPEIFEQYLYNMEHAYHLDFKTLKSYKINLLDFNKHMFNNRLDVTLEDIKVLHAEDILIHFLRVKESLGMSGASINSRIAAIRSFYRYYTARGELVDISRNIPLFKRETKTCDILTFDECKILLNNVRNKMILDSNIETSKMNLIFSIFLGSGLRISEVHNLNISSFDIENNCLNIVNSKFGKSRSIIIPTQLIDDLHLYLNFRLKLNEKLDESLHDCLFISRKRNRLSDVQIRKSVYKEMSELGFEDKDVHSLRKSYCTNLIDEGCPVHVVSDILGHSNTNVTLQIYNKPKLKDTSEFNKLFEDKKQNKNDKIIQKNDNVIQLKFGVS